MSAETAYNVESMQKADEYLKKHRIAELFNDLCASICFHKPKNVRQFLLQELQLKESEGAEAGLFEESEIDAVFALADLMQTGTISNTQCKEALLSLANSEKQQQDCKAVELPAEVDIDTFREKAKEVLKIP
eukprot:gnl/MRDRNA2_/MRDRNA2_97706_c0_seq1.p2 gnl/MRDRNA2_/MRDRNA2_97706_c0~~gnl/MRDRNA2_/MRDRNA2_97706_c0_seq1.p2  ORF type:complete len:132 (+),score=43.47 gnl/MRDRNA2_/MRDRNA2_97706_c0_seq1:89-484(+)